VTGRQRGLLLKGRQKLGAAKTLLAQGYPEDAASRAYYVMFYVAEAFLDGEGLTFSSHSAVTGEFGRLFAKTGRVPSEYHRFMLEAQQDRQGGDYVELFSLLREIAATHVERAERFLALAENLIGQPT